MSLFVCELFVQVNMLTYQSYVAIFSIYNPDDIQQYHEAMIFFELDKCLFENHCLQMLYKNLQTSTFNGFLVQHCLTAFATEFLS